MWLLAAVTSLMIGDYTVFMLDPVPANSHEKIGELACCRCCNTLLTNHFRNIVPANLFDKSLFIRISLF